MGENAWTNKSFTVTDDGRHTLSWLYVKDEEGKLWGQALSSKRLRGSDAILLQ
jgi:hypothetical protein